MSNVGGVSTTQAMQSVDLGPTGSLQMMFAKLQLALAEQAKTGAMNHINDIQESQAQQKEVADFISKARELREQVKDKGASEMPAEMIKYMDDNNIAYDKTGKDKLYYEEMISDAEEHDPTGIFGQKQWAESIAITNKHHNKDEWDFNIKSLQNYQEQLGTNTQQKMVFVQDFMGQYNSYLQGANTQINQSNQTLTALARGQ